MALKIKQLERVSHKPHYRRKTLYGSKWQKEFRYPEINYEEHPDINFEHHGLRGVKGPKKWRRKNYI